MKKHLAVLLVLVTSPALAANFAGCLLDGLPRVANDVAANATMQVCLSKFPGGFEAVKQGVGRGLFSFNSGAECTAKKAGGTRSNQAAHLIGAACRKLYDEPEPGFTYEEAVDELKAAGTWPSTRQSRP